ncbi:ABC transporter permease subunit [Geodermatophilus sp. SYSU D00814]
MFGKAVWDARRSLAGWTVAIAVVGVVYAAFWPTISTPEVQEAVAAYPRALLEAFNVDELTSPEGYLGSSVYGMLLPLLVAVAMTAWGTRIVGTDEEAGTLDLVLAHPVSRRQLALQRIAAVLVGAVVVAVGLWLAMLALSGAVDLSGISAAELAAMDLHLALFGGFCAALAFAVGAATGRRTVTLSVSAGVVVLAYLANSVLPQVDALSWTRDLSPFHWYLGGDPLAHGVQPGGALALLAATAVLVGVGAAVFTRRDIGT